MLRRALALLLVALPAAAFDPYEIQVYDGTANNPGQFGVELHLNYASQDAGHATVEPSFGVTRFWELGAYLEFDKDGFGGAKLRSKFVTPPGTLENFRLGVNFELARERGQTGGEIRPILAFETHRVLLAVNPIVGFDSNGSSFEPAGMIKLRAARHVLAGFEYYGSPAESLHYVFGAIDLVDFPGLELNLGAGVGISGKSNPFIVKTILGYTF